MKVYRNTPRAPLPVPTHQPMLWAALVFSAGILLGSYFWRPVVWWLTAIACIVSAAFYFLNRRRPFAYALGLCALLFAGAIAIQMRLPKDSGVSGIGAFADGHEVRITGHVTREGEMQNTSSDDVRQTLELETDKVDDAWVKAGVRVSLRAQDPAPPHPLFRYGQRISFPAKLYFPHNYRNPGGFDFCGYLADRGIAVSASAKLDGVEILPGFVGSRLERWRTRIHRSIIEKIHTLWPAREAGLIDAMVIGEDAFLERTTRTDFQKSGTYHVLVVSGMNVGILAFSLLWMLRCLRVNDMTASALTILLCLVYAFLTDVGAPIWRATLMLVLYLGARAFYRRGSILNALGAAAFGLLVVDPKAVLSASFQLTFLCVLLIASSATPLLERLSQPYLRGLKNFTAVSYDWVLPPKVAQLRLELRMLAKPLSRMTGRTVSMFILPAAARIILGGFDLLFVSALMQIGLALPMAYYFHRVTSLGLIANLLVIPLTDILMPAAILALSLDYISSALASVPAWIASVAVRMIASSVQWFGGFRAADLRVATPTLLTVFCGVAALVCAMVLARQRSRLVAATGIGALAASAFFITLIPVKPNIRLGALELTAIDVGQGDSLLVVSPTGRTLLIDAGGLPFWGHPDFDIGENVVAPYLWSRGISQLDAVAVTHAHSDHAGGMASVVENFHPRQLWIGKESHDPEMAELLKVASDLKIGVIPRHTGDNFELGGANFAVLAPDRKPTSRVRGQNDESLVLRVSYGATSMVLEGDAEKATEQKLAKEIAQSDLLKVAHHGSATSTIPELLGAMHPRFAVISVGSHNSYGHPRNEVLQRLQNAKVSTFRTDLDGAVTFYLDGKNVTSRLAALP